MKVSKQIEEKVKTRPKGSFVFISDFTNEFDYEVARKMLQRITKKNGLIRLSRGIYYRPKESKNFGVIYPTAEQLAEAIAQRDKARIIPTGSYAQYKLGLSTQIPMNVVYLTDGSARKVQIGSQKIVFKNTSPKNLAIDHQLSNLIIQALKGLNKNSITPDVKNMLKKFIIKSGEIEKVKRNIINAPVRIQKIILQIINEIENG